MFLFLYIWLFLGAFAQQRVGNRTAFYGHVRTVGWTTYLGMEEDWSSSGVMIPVLLLQRFLGVCPFSISRRV